MQLLLDRRRFLKRGGGLFGACSVAFWASQDQRRRVRRIGFIIGSTTPSLIEAFRDALNSPGAPPGGSRDLVIRGLRTITRTTLVASVGFVAMLAEPMPAHVQARLKVLADTPLRPALLEIAEAFSRSSGQHVDFVFESSPVLLRKLADGEAADVLILQPEHLPALMTSGKVVAGPHPVIGRIGLGLAVRADAHPRSIATVEALREVLLNADTLLFNTVASGEQFAAILERLNLTEAVKAKVVRLPPGPAIYERVRQGTGNEIAAGVIPIIIETKGVKLLGALAAELQSYQTYAAAPMTGAASPETARRFVGFLSSPTAKASFLANGVE